VASPVTLAAGAENTDYTITAAALLAGVTVLMARRCRSLCERRQRRRTIVSNPDSTFTPRRS
jgi:hypothetical protein